MAFEILTKEYKSTEDHTYSEVVPWLEENLGERQFLNWLWLTDGSLEKERREFFQLRDDAVRFGIQVPDGTDQILKANGSNWVMFMMVSPTGWPHLTYFWVNVSVIVFDEMLSLQCKLALFVE